MNRPRSSLLASLGLLALPGVAAADVDLGADGFALVRSSAECQTYMGPREVDGVTPVRIRCHWADVQPPALEEMFNRFDGYHVFVWALSDSRIYRAGAERSLVWQRHEVAGTAPRETLVWLEARPNSAGSLCYTWTTAPDEPLELSPGAIRAPRNDGLWNILPTPGGGVDVVLELAYAPGGWVPDWLVRWCQTLGADRMMAEIRQEALRRQSTR